MNRTSNLQHRIRSLLFRYDFRRTPPHAFTPLLTYAPAIMHQCITSDSHPHPHQQNQLIDLAYPNRPYTWEKNGQAQSAPATSSVEGGNGTGTGTGTETTDSLFSVSVMNSMFFFVFSSSSFVPLFLSFRQSSIQLFYCPFYSQQFIFVCILIFIKQLYPYNRQITDNSHSHRSPPRSESIHGPGHVLSASDGWKRDREGLSGGKKKARIEEGEWEEESKVYRMPTGMRM